ncbi:TPA: hypothetical protein ACH3X1_016224 [Trebouxia sp. C0004]
MNELRKQSATGSDGLEDQKTQHSCTLALECYACSAIPINPNHQAANNVYAACTSDSEIKGKFAPDLVGKNSVPSLTSLLNKVLKVLNDDVAKSGVHANHVYSENKATCSSLSAEYDQIFGQTKNEPKFGLATTVSQA